MSGLWIASQALWWVGFTLSILEVVKVPRQIMCDCRTGWMAFSHMKSLWLFILGAAYIVSGVLGMLDGISTPLSAVVPAVGAYYLWRWWKHNKNKRKKLKDRALGVVRETAAGLKVVPAPSTGGAR